MTHERGNPLAFRSPLMLDDFELDSERSRDWSAALVQYAVAQRPANAELLKQWVTHWNRPSYLSMEALVELFGPAPRPLQPEAVAAAKVRAAHSLRSQYG
jgi:toluene monooxygenase system protein E